VLPVDKSDKERLEMRESAPQGGKGSATRDKWKWVHAYPEELRWRAVQLVREEGMGLSLVAAELGVSEQVVGRWVRRYERYGKAGLKTRRSGPQPGKPTGARRAVGEQIIAIKKNNPHFGVKRISQILRRLFLLKASPETVRKRLKKAGLGTKQKKARKTPEPKIHFFERTAPNETWQTDITIVNILGRPAYIIAFIDDYSRYIVALGVFRSQTADNVMEVYRTAAAQYGAPKEMLTDNGRQYANWRGMTKFQKELNKDRVHHIRSQPHHPQTLGKIERFWKSLKEEFLDRARFDTFEEMQERTKFWIKYYNHKRPHQGIDGVCPADRYFSVQNSLRQVIAKGVEDNVEELALRGVPVKPFYMVGQMGDQSVVLRGDKGKLRMLVGGEEGKEMVYDLKEKKDEDGRESGAEISAVEGIQREREMPGGSGSVVGAQDAILAVQGDEHQLGRVERVGEERPGRYSTGAGSRVEAGESGRDSAGETDRGSALENSAGRTSAGRQSELKEHGYEDRRTREDMEGGREVPGSVGNMDGTQESGGNTEGDGDKREPVDSVAGPSDRRDAGGIGTQAHERNTDMSGAGEHSAETAGQESASEGNRGNVETGKENDETAGGQSRSTGIEPGKEEDGRIERSEINGETAAGYPGSGRPDESHRGGGQDGSEPEDLLQVGEACSDSDTGSSAGEGLGAAREGCGHGERGLEAGNRGAEEGVALAGAEASHS
jgi:transposase InsO family protein